MDYGRLVLQRWDQGADRIPDLNVYGPPPIARMTEQLFGADGIYGPDIRARVEHRSSLDVFEARGGNAAAHATGAARHRDPRRARWSRAPAGRSRSATRSTCSPISSAWRFASTPSEGSICYTGDSGPSDTIVELAKGCDMLIHMNHYFSGTEPTPAYRAPAAIIATTPSSPSAPASKTLVLTHLLGADRPAGHPRADRPRDPGGVRGQGDLGRGPDAARPRGLADLDDRDPAGMSQADRPRGLPAGRADVACCAVNATALSSVPAAGG